MSKRLTIGDSNNFIAKFRLKLCSIEKNIISEKLDKTFYIDPEIYYGSSSKYPAIIYTDDKKIKPLFNAVSDRMLLIRGHYGEEIRTSLGGIVKSLGMFLAYAMTLAVGCALVVKTPSIIISFMPMSIIVGPIACCGGIMICWWTGKQIFSEICNFGSSIFGTFSNTFRWTNLYFKQRYFEKKCFLIQQEGLKQLLADIKEDNIKKNEAEKESKKYESEFIEIISESCAHLKTYLS